MQTDRRWVIGVLHRRIKNKEKEDDQFTIKDKLGVRKSYVNKLLLAIRRVCLTTAREGFTDSLMRKLAEQENKRKPNQTTKKTPPKIKETTKKTPAFQNAYIEEVICDAYKKRLDLMIKNISYSCPRS